MAMRSGYPERARNKADALPGRPVVARILKVVALTVVCSYKRNIVACMLLYCAYS